jgi:RimJ/RimL family protein N-acetyltransferase
MIRTERLLLRPILESDLTRLLEFWNLPEVTRWLLRGECSLDDLRSSWQKAMNNPDDHSVAIVLDDVVIGTVSVELADGFVQPGGPTRTVADLGYTLDPAYAGHGYATEAARAVVDMAFDELGVRRVTAGAFVDNTASVRVLEKLGMRREEHAVRDSWHAELGWVDGCTYALLVEDRRRATEWP